MSSGSGQTFAAPTFSGKAYASYRPKHPPALLASHILPAVTSGRTLALDIGCGPATFTFTFTLAPHVDHVIGIDPSEVMLAAIDPAKRAAAPNVEFRVGGAESLEGIADGSVDLITAAEAAHWFPNEWWKEAKRVLKPGGQVALFLHAVGLPDPSTPGIDAVLAANLKMRTSLLPFNEQGNIVVEGLYDDLPVPAEGDSWGPVIRRKWLTTDVKVGEPFFMSQTARLSFIGAALATGSSVFRWRAADPNIKPEEDVVNILVSDLKGAIGGTDDSPLTLGFDVVLLLVQKL